VVKLKELLGLRNMVYSDKIKPKHQKRMEIQLERINPNVIVPKVTPPENDAAVTIPEKVAPPYTFKVTPVPTLISEVVVTPDITKPLETVGAPFAILFVITLVLILDILLFDYLLLIIK